MRDAEELREARVTVALARMRREVIRHTTIAPFGEHVDPQWARRLVQVDVLTVTLLAPDVDRRGLLQAAPVTQADPDGFRRD
jgi:hypothetical protein